ncbi:MAG: thioredoxin family protein [Cyclobacteriaceae bacterium]
MRQTFLIVACGLVLFGIFFVSAKDTELGYVPGDKVKDFKLENVDGQQVSLSSIEAKGYIIAFTCNTCPYAKAYEQRIIDLDKKYSKKGFKVVAINPNDASQQAGDSMEEMRKRADEKGYTFPYLRDDDQVVTRVFGAKKTPHVYVVNKQDNDLIVEYVGAIDNSPRDAADVTEKYVESAVDALLRGEKPTVTEKRAIGCSIVWKES